MTPTTFIGRHLDKSDIEKPVIDGICRCKLCGAESDKGVSKMISDTFTDTAYFQYPASDVICMDCAVCLGKIIVPDTGKKTFFRNFSFICSESSLNLLKRENLLDVLLNPPKPPFILCITFSNKKHMSFKAGIQVDREKYFVTTDTGDIFFDVGKANEILKIIRQWYAVIPEKVETKAQPTWFTKDDILYGCTNYKKIEAYGIEKYFSESQQIEQHRRTLLLKLLVFCLNKTF